MIDWGQNAVCIVCLIEAPLTTMQLVGTGGSYRCCDVTACVARHRESVSA